MPYEAIAFDLVLGLPRSQAGNDAVLVVLDVFSRMVTLAPCKSTIDAVGIAAIVSDKVGVPGPRRLISDSEARITGRVMQALAASLQARATPSSSHHEQANVVERAVQTVQQALRALTETSAAHWDRRAVPAVELAMNSTPNVTTGYSPFDLIFITHPGPVHALFDASLGGGEESFDDKLLAATERLDEARRAVAAARAQQKRRYDAARMPLPILRVGDEVFVRLRDRPVPGHGQGKLDARKLGPFRVREVLSAHRVRLDLSEDLGIGTEFAVDQLDVRPSSPDPFQQDRDSPEIPSAGPVSAAPAGDSVGDGLEAPSHDEGDDVAEVDGSTALGERPANQRSRTAPAALRDFVFTVEAGDTAVPSELLRGPLDAPKQVQVGNRSVLLRERPIAYQSRLTTPSEKRLVAAELELCCLAWSFARMAHLLEGAEVTVVTDHLPMGPMLLFDAGGKYGPTISRCRALFTLASHLHNFRFRHRPGKIHKNVDALSRLTPPS
ncbi:hypothetical protein A4X13_0g7082 [Tilletia indica]|uniref:Integrase catalytic domain-containing protein n=1 Tax=Tilletia indica TaxID=43049 RepID=A0A177T6V2_9BASI|nr:hypothetical protein A4X13_0g7082 [Tilletia indica]